MEDNSFPDVAKSGSEKRLVKHVLFIWLDPDMNENKEIQSSIEHLKMIIPCALSTNDYDECEQWLINYDDNKQIFVIVSNKFGRQLVPHIHLLPSIAAIYIYCTDRKIHTKWTEKYSKILSIAAKTEKIVQKVVMDAKNPRRMRHLTSQFTQLSDVQEISENNKNIEEGIQLYFF